MRGTSDLWSVFGPLLIAMPRLLAAITAAPLVPAGLFPMLVRNTVVVSLSLGVYPHVAANMPTALAPAGWLVWISKEVFVGTLIGFAAGRLVWAFESVGAMIDIQIGLSNGLLFDPFGGQGAGPFSGLMTRFAVMFFVMGGGLYVFTSLLYESLRLWPVASFYPVVDARLADFAAGYAGSMAQLIVRLAAPVVLLLAIIDLGFGLVNRVVPQLNVFFFTMPIKGVLAALMLAIYLSSLADIAAGQTSELRMLLERLAGVVGHS
jgi:type III secretion protein T